MENVSDALLLSRTSWAFTVHARAMLLLVAALASTPVAGAGTDSRSDPTALETVTPAEAVAAGLSALRAGDTEKFGWGCGFASPDVRALADQGNGAAQLCLVFAHAFGWGDSERNATLTLKWVTRAAKDGLQEAQFLLGRRLLLATGEDYRVRFEETDFKWVPRNPEMKPVWDQAVSWLESAAASGNADAQVHLAELVPGMAVDLLGQAAAQGCAHASYKLGSRHIGGRGVEQSDTKAMARYLDGAKRGHVESQWAVALGYSRGRGLPKDRALAYAWSNVAAASGHSSGSAMRDSLETDMTPSETALAQALSRDIVDKQKPDVCGNLIPDDALPALR